MQDRIIGPLTMIQFIYAVIGGGFCYTLYMSLPSPLSLLISTPVALFTVAVIFIKVNERPFLQFLSSVMLYISSPKQRVWQHGDSDLTIEVYRDHKDTTLTYQTKEFSRDDIKRAADQLDNTKFRK